MGRPVIDAFRYTRRQRFFYRARDTSTTLAGSKPVPERNKAASAIKARSMVPAITPPPPFLGLNILWSADIYFYTMKHRHRMFLSSPPHPRRFFPLCADDLDYTSWRRKAGPRQRRPFSRPAGRREPPPPAERVHQHRLRRRGNSNGSITEHNAGRGAAPSKLFLPRTVGSSHTSERSCRSRGGAQPRRYRFYRRAGNGNTVRRWQRRRQKQWPCGSGGASSGGYSTCR